MWLSNYFNTFCIHICFLNISSCSGVVNGKWSKTDFKKDNFTTCALEQTFSLSFFFCFAVLITNIKREGKLIPENSTIFLCKCTDGTENCAHSVSTPSASVTMVISDVFSWRFRRPRQVSTGFSLFCYLLCSCLGLDNTGEPHTEHNKYFAGDQLLVNSFSWSIWIIARLTQVCR